MKLTKLLLIGGLMCVSKMVLAHGYVDTPASRAFLCRTVNSNCGSVQWEPQSLEGPSGFPSSGPADGQIASAGNSGFAVLNEQTPTRWNKVSMTSGQHEFRWTLTAPHNTRAWRYFMTKQDWNPSEQLTRASFDLTPFCEIPDSGRPGATATQTCTVPHRTGYQVMLAVWEIGDTTNSFYNVVDLDFGNDNGGGETPETDKFTTRIGVIQAETDLSPGDSVKARFFTSTNELHNDAVTLPINSTQEGDRNFWSHALAQKINQTYPDLKAGVRDANGEIEPVYGDNPVYTKDGSQFARMEIEQIHNQANVPALSLHVSGVNDVYTTDDNHSLELHFTAHISGAARTEARVFGPEQQEKGYSSAEVENSDHAFTLPLTHLTAGHYALVVNATSTSTHNSQESENNSANNSKQVTVNFNVMTPSTPEPGPQPDIKYDYVFPEGLTHYEAGTKVLQPQNNRVYECRPFPNSGLCRQWSVSSNGYEPGMGFAWEEAWTLVTH